MTKKSSGHIPVRLGHSSGTFRSYPGTFRS